MPNNLDAIRRALESAGIEFVPESDGGPGVLVRRLRLRPYIPGVGLYVEAQYADLFLEAPDNDRELSFIITDDALAALAGRLVVGEADAKAVARVNDARLLRIVKTTLGFKRPGGRPLDITADDVARS